MNKIYNTATDRSYVHAQNNKKSLKKPLIGRLVTR